MAVSRSLRFQILRRDGHKCRYCGVAAPDAKLTVDHVIPEALGGTDDPSNLVTACDKCNGGKSATPPDAAHVAQVADDAIRWAEALKVAAAKALGVSSARQREHAEFDEIWNDWTCGEDKAPVPRMPNWASSIDQFLAAGLPMPILLECLDIAMRNSKVKPIDTFRYMCGIAWRRVSEIQEAARQHLHGTASASVEGDDEDPTDLNAIALSLATTLDEQNALSDDVSADEVDDLAILRVSEIWRLMAALDRLFEQLPQEKVQLARKDAAVDGDKTDVEVALATAKHLATSYAADYIETLDADELREWVLIAQTRHPEADNDILVMEAAQTARAYKATGAIQYDMCFWSGQHGASCHNKAAFKLFYTSCPICGDRPCRGHTDVCETHLEPAIENGHVFISGAAVDIADFKPFDNSDPWDF